MEEYNQAKEDRREARRRRRLRNQIAAYITVIILILGAGAGIVWEVKNLTEGREEAEQEAQASQLSRRRSLLLRSWSLHPSRNWTRS